MGTHAPSGRLLRCRWRADAWDLPQSLAGWIGGGDLFDFCVHRSNLLFEIFPLAPEQADKVTHPWCEVRVGVLHELRHRVSLAGFFAKVMPRSSRKARSWLITEVHGRLVDPARGA